MTDHGVMNGALDMYKACRAPRHQADSRHRGVLRRRPDRGAAAAAMNANHLTLLAENNTGFANQSAFPRKASSRAITAARRTWTWSCSSATPEGVIALTGCLQARFREASGSEDRPDEVAQAP
ncbi:MAG: PHP domain-containing protein [Thermoleophilales bacterium]|nr:PHP domain-containing protein [Thermoleophilales bacterium]